MGPGFFMGYNIHMRGSRNSHFPLSELASLLASGQRAFLVGGTVRDMALGRPTKDLDLAADGDLPALARRIAERLDGTAFVIDAARDVHRVVARGGTGAQVDIAPLKGDILTDLSVRDFTINAMALPITGGRRVAGVSESLGEIIDPFGGMADIGRRVIRAIGREALEDDPLRMLRAFRLSRQLGFDIEKGTLSLVGELGRGIRDVSAERVRDELYMVLSDSGSARTFLRMAEAGLLKEVLPETSEMAGLAQGEPHDYDLLGHSIKSMEHAEVVMADLGGYFGTRERELRSYLDEEVDGGLKMGGLVKLCALLHDSGKPVTLKYEGGRTRFIGHDEEGARINGDMAERLRMSARSARAIAVMTRGHMRPLHMSKRGMTRHALYRYARDMGEDLPGSLVVALADALAANVVEIDGVIERRTRRPNRDTIEQDGMERFRDLESLKGQIAVGHCRYSTTGGSTWNSAGKDRQVRIRTKMLLARWRRR